MQWRSLIEQITHWVQTHSTAMWWLGGLSAVTFVLTLAAIPLLVVRIPADYFSREHRGTTLWSDRHPVIRGVLLVAKNMLGMVFVLAGIAMLMLPGQGLLTILVGLLLINFPGKYQLEKWLVTRTPVLRAANWLRSRSGYPPIQDHQGG
jgi:hypothetical protein